MRAIAPIPIALTLLTALAAGPASPPSLAADGGEAREVTVDFEDAEGRAAYSSADQIVATLKDLSGKQVASLSLNLETRDFAAKIEGRIEKGRSDSLKGLSLESTVRALHAAWVDSSGAEPMAEGPTSGGGQQVASCIHNCDGFGCILQCFWVSLPSPDPSDD